MSRSETPLHPSNLEYDLDEEKGKDGCAAAGSRRAQKDWLMDYISANTDFAVMARVAESFFVSITLISFSWRPSCLCSWLPLSVQLPWKTAYFSLRISNLPEQS
jgi:hypothetical protein